MDSVVAQISAIAAPGSRLCLDTIPRDLIEGRAKPSRGFINGRDVRCPRAPASETLSSHKTPAMS